ncbi:MAG TPA: S8 family serine peptidase [Longimicrobiales bacterium]
MHRSLPLVAVGLLALACSDIDTTAPAVGNGPALSRVAASDDYVPGRVLARFMPGANAAAEAARHGATVQGEVAFGIMMLQVPVGAEYRVVNALSNNPNVEFAEPDFIRTSGTPAAMPVNDPFIGYKWDLDNTGTLYNSTGAVVVSGATADADIDWKEAYEYLGGQTGGSVIVGIMDTGIRADHEDLAGRIAAGYDFFASDGDPADDNGHGTHVAGIIAAASNNAKGVSGVAFGDVRFAIAKVCGQIYGGPNGYGCPSSATASGIRWAVDNGAAVLNLSLGGATGSATEQAALQYARANNVLPFCATGNDNGPVSYPAAFPECIGVAATDWHDGRASYSNFGPEAELAAPGGDDENANGYSYILSSYYDSPTSYAFMAGTSMATPQVVGLAALLHALGYSDDDAKLQRLISTVDDLGAAGRDQQFGYGRINAYRAVSGTTPPPSNAAPNASFTQSCSELACSFNGSGSTDPDGTIVAYAWTFGDGTSASGATASKTYAAAGTYTVTLTVTDDDGATDSQTATVTVTSSTGSAITLSATGRKVRGSAQADLSWSGATASSVDVYRNNVRVTTTANDGAHTDVIGKGASGTFTYRVCNAGTTTCSNNASVSF